MPDFVAIRKSGEYGIIEEAVGIGKQADAHTSIVDAGMGLLKPLGNTYGKRYFRPR